jgi:hypothetical protein
MCTVVLLMQSAIVFGQPGDPGNPDQVPITGLEYLVGGGVLYGIRSLLKARKKHSD